MFFCFFASFKIAFRMKNSIFLLVCICSFYTQAQIVNIESLRRVSDTSKWSGYTSLELSLIKNRNDIINVKNDIHIQYRNKKNLILLINKLDFKEANDDALVNKGIQHLRYNYAFKPKVSWEAFAQSQYDAISKISFRGLLGSGFRFTLWNNPKYKIFLGNLFMYEYEENKIDEERFYHRDFRGSSYLSCSLHPSDAVSFVSTTYYQPRLNNFEDYRLSNETSLALRIFKNLAFKSTFTYVYDAFPVEGIPNTQYKFTNGILYSFD